MRKITFLVAIVVAVLWWLASTLIAAPTNIQSMVTGGMTLTSQKDQALEIVLFLISIVVITGWALSVPEGEETETVITTTSTNPTPS